MEPGLTPAPANPGLVLSPTERAGVWLAELLVRRFPSLHVALSFFPMGALVWLGIGRRLRLRGTENVRGLPADGSLLFVANHRSFFDFFAVIVTLRLKAGFRHRMYFPVRSEFFYDHPLGVLINLLAAGMSMFPPIFRSGPKRALNRWSLDRCAEELAKPRTAVGLHPEGTRNRGSDPFRLLPAHSGPGRIALAVPHARVLPVFILGLGNRVLAEIAHNLLAPQRHPVWMSFGPEIDLSDLRRTARAGVGQEAGDARQAAERCRAALESLGEAVRREASDPASPGAGRSPSFGRL